MYACSVNALNRSGSKKSLLLPEAFNRGCFLSRPSHPRIDIAAKNVPSLQMGGDYFDILEAQQGNLLLAIGDVSGKGPSAALLMANLQAMLHVLLSVDISLEEATGRINDMIYQNTPGNKFVTFFWGLLNPETLQLWYVNAGHNPPLLFENSGTGIRELNEGGLILGAMPTMKPYRGDTAALSSGDLLACYTDGITEAMSEYQREEYGKERLLECIHAHHRQPSQQIIQAIIDDVEHFSDRAQQDDITLIVIKVK
jgi:sigma-B regulation protein RsbU (phosphoserine phosphatase)